MPVAQVEEGALVAVTVVGDHPVGIEPGEVVGPTEPAAETAAAGGEAAGGVAPPFGQGGEFRRSLPAAADDIDDARDGVGAVQGALGAAGDLHALDPVGRQGRHVHSPPEIVHRDAVHHHRVVLGFPPADEHAGHAAAAAALVDLDPGDAAQAFIGVLRRPVLQVLSGHQADRGADLGNQRAPEAGRDHHLGCHGAELELEVPGFGSAAGHGRLDLVRGQPGGFGRQPVIPVGKLLEPVGSLDVRLPLPDDDEGAEQEDPGVGHGFPLGIGDYAREGSRQRGNRQRQGDQDVNEEQSIPIHGMFPRE